MNDQTKLKSRLDRSDSQFNVLILNCGSSSVRFTVYNRTLEHILRGHLEKIGTGTPDLALSKGECSALPPDCNSHQKFIAFLLDSILPHNNIEIGAVGHRVVHGGTELSRPVQIDAAIRREIEKLIPLAPLHQPHNLAGIDAIFESMPEIPQIACFDTAFHSTIPKHRQRMALPGHFHDLGLRRYGFHGLAYDHLYAEFSKMPGFSPQSRLVACHLGNGCSVAGIRDGKSLWTSMGFTPLDGLIMGQRPGRLDPGAVLFIVEHCQSVEEARKILNHQSGLLGISGISADMRLLLDSDESEAKMAVLMFVDRLVQEIACAAGAIGGIDALVFSGGIGQNAAAIRKKTLTSLDWLGFDLDPEANKRHAMTITKASSRPAAHVIAADEERVIARTVKDMLGFNETA